MADRRPREPGFSPSPIIGGGKVEEGRSWVRSGPRTVECTVCIPGGNIGPAMSLYSPHLFLLSLSSSSSTSAHYSVNLQLATRVSLSLLSDRAVDRALCPRKGHSGIETEIRLFFKAFFARRSVSLCQRITRYRENFSSIDREKGGGDDISTIILCSKIENDILIMERFTQTF